MSWWAKSVQAVPVAVAEISHLRWLQLRTASRRTHTSTLNTLPPPLSASPAGGEALAGAGRTAAPAAPAGCPAAGCTTAPRSGRGRATRIWGKPGQGGGGGGRHNEPSPPPPERRPTPQCPPLPAPRTGFLCRLCKGKRTLPTKTSHPQLVSRLPLWRTTPSKGGDLMPLTSTVISGWGGVCWLRRGAGTHETQSTGASSTAQGQGCARGSGMGEIPPPRPTQPPHLLPPSPH